MSAIARMTMLDLRTVLPYRGQGLILFAVVLLVDVRNPASFVPALALLVTSQLAAYPFMIADKEGLHTLYAVVPLPRRAVLWGHYAWALVSCVVTVVVGLTMTVVLSKVQSIPLNGHVLATELTVAWALFALSIAIQFLLFIRFGYTRTSALATTLPLALVMLAVVKLHVTIASVQVWFPLLWAAGAGVVVVSAGVATAADRRRMRG